jgi:hypothetical protein
MQKMQTQMHTRSKQKQIDNLSDAEDANTNACNEQTQKHLLAGIFFDMVA